MQTTNRAAASSYGSSSELAKSLFRTPKRPTSMSLSSDTSSVGSVDRRSSRCWTGEMISDLEFEIKLKYDMKYRAQAVQAAAVSPQSNDLLACLLALFQWSACSATGVKAEQECRIINEFIRFNSPREIIVNPELREVIINNDVKGDSNEVNMNELKQCIVIELTFDPLLDKLLYV